MGVASATNLSGGGGDSLPVDYDFEATCRVIDDDFNPPGYESGDDEWHRMEEAEKSGFVNDTLSKESSEPNISASSRSGDTFVAATTSSADEEVDEKSIHFEAISQMIDDDFNPPGYESDDEWRSVEETVEKSDLAKESSGPNIPPSRSCDTFLIRTSWASSDGDETSIQKDTEVKDKHHGTSNNRMFCLVLWSNIWFVIGSVFYMWFAVIDFRWMSSIQDIPDWVLVADDDYSWADYPIEDDYVFETPKGTWVSLSQIVYAIASFSFIVTGIIGFFHLPFFYGFVFLLAGGFGFLSACYQDLNVRYSNIFNAVSVHLFMLEALGILARRTVVGGILKCQVRMANVLFVIAAGIEVGLSYTYIFDTYNFKLSKLSITASSFWLLVSVIYLGTTLYGKKRGVFDTYDDGEEKLDDGHEMNGMESSDELSESDYSFDSLK